jgi:ribosomal protein S19E (S16A)
MDFSAHKSSIYSKNSLNSTHKSSVYGQQAAPQSPSMMTANGKIFSKIQKNLENGSLVNRRNSLKRMNPAVKSAIYTMLAIVTSYLVSNTLHLVLSVLER